MQSITAQAHLVAREIAFIIKCNQHTSPVEAIDAKCAADPSTQWVRARAGKCECLWQETLKLATVAMNLLRLIGQNTQTHLDRAVRHVTKCRRIKTTM